MPISTAVKVARLRLVGQIFNEEAINVYYYANEDGSALITDLATLFAATPLSHILAITSNQYICNSIEVEEVKGGTAFTSLSIASNGTISGDCLPPYASWDFTLTRGGVGERNGYKRFAGVAESSQVDGVNTSGIAASLQVVALDLGAALGTGTASWFPVIRRTRVNRVPQNPPVYYTFIGGAYAKIGTQNSRKFGHGR